MISLIEARQRQRRSEERQQEEKLPTMTHTRTRVISPRAFGLGPWLPLEINHSVISWRFHFLIISTKAVALPFFEVSIICALLLLARLKLSLQLTEYIHTWCNDQNIAFPLKKKKKLSKAFQLLVLQTKTNRQKKQNMD